MPSGLESAQADRFNLARNGVTVEEVNLNPFTPFALRKEGVTLCD